MLELRRETTRKGEDEMSSKKILLLDDSSTARLVTPLIFSQKSNYLLLSAGDGRMPWSAPGPKNRT